MYTTIGTDMSKSLDFELLCLQTYDMKQEV